MRIKEIKSRHRRDFTAVYECEHCGHEENGTGYDDSYFHNTVIPGMACNNCGEKADMGSYKPMTPRYPDHLQI